MEDVRPWHPDAGSSQTIQCVDLSTLPSLFPRLASKAGTLRHRAGLTAVFRLAVLCVIHCLSKTAFLGLFVDFRATCLVATAYDEDHRLLAAHELAHNAVDQPLFEQRLEPPRYLH